MYLDDILLVFLDELQGGVVGLVNQLSHLTVDYLSRGLTIRLLKHSLSLPWHLKGDLSYFAAHAKLSHLRQLVKQTNSARDGLMRQ